MRPSRPRLKSSRALERSETSHGRGVAPAWVIESSVVAYVLLWGFEGAIRKWIPGTETLLYIGRDAFLITVFVALLTFTRSQAAKSWWFWVLSFLMLFIAGFHVIDGLTSAPLAINGARSYIAPFLLLAFVQVFNTPRLARWIIIAVCVVALANLPIALLQVLSSPESLVNKEVGTEAAHFVNPGGIVRPSGTFSAPAGFSSMLPVALAVAFAGSFSSRIRPVWSTMVVVSVVTMAAISGARSAVISVGFVLFAYAWLQLRQGKANAFITLFISGGVLYLLYQVLLGLLPQVLDSFATRVEQASQAEDSSARVINSIFGFFNVATEPLGSGLGAFSSAAVLVTGNQQWVETENARWAVELGALGVLMVVSRLIAGAALFAVGFFGSATVRPGQKILFAYLSLALLAATLNQIPSHQGAFAIALTLTALLGAVEHGDDSKQSTEWKRSLRRELQGQSASSRLRRH